MESYVEAYIGPHNPIGTLNHRFQMKKYGFLSNL